MQNVKAARFDPMPDRPQTQTASKQLLAGDHTVLATRQRRQLAFALDERPASFRFGTCR
jgi:hypothetical protein